MIDEKYKWIYPYTMACVGTNLVLFEQLINSEKFRNFFRGDFSKQRARDYFMGPHNEETISMMRNRTGMDFHAAPFHLAIPYEIFHIRKTKVSGVISEPFYEDIPAYFSSRSFDKEIERAARLGVFEEELKKGQIIISHALNIAATCEKKDLEEYKSLYRERIAAA